MRSVELNHLHRCIELATEALELGDEPFGSVLVDEKGIRRQEARNQIAAGDRTQHPEFALARWAAEHMTLAERAGATVYTSGEHCPMCAAAHAWVGLGRIVYACSSAQLARWLDEWGVPSPPVRMLPIQEIAPTVIVEGPAEELTGIMRELHYRSHHERLEPAPK